FFAPILSDLTAAGHRWPRSDLWRAVAAVVMAAFTTTRKRKPPSIRPFQMKIIAKKQVDPRVFRAPLPFWSAQVMQNGRG
ncbi:MAG: hypothetical protein LUQ34_01155, partial [Euryarchaeota archaeon]|nr:hypothetical protein [Euryarchaeota archaeon]